MKVHIPVVPSWKILVVVVMVGGGGGGGAVTDPGDYKRGLQTRSIELIYVRETAICPY